jgi:PAB-dependent poly(A)-specific ribonuclease subunit 3
VSEATSKKQNLENELVQVIRNGCIFFVHRSQAATGQAADATFSNMALARRETNSLVQTVEPWEQIYGRFLSSTGAATPRWGGVCTSLGLPDALRHQLEAQSNEMLRQLEPEDERYLEIPPEYGAAWPLDLDEQTTRNIAGSFGYPSVMYKVIDRRSGKPYTLRRVDGARNSPKAAAATQMRWRSVRHANLVSLKRAFVHSGATYFLHDYFASAKTLLESYFPPCLDSQRGMPLVPESTLWGYLLQLVAVLRVVHATTGACRTVGLSRILITNNARIRLANVGVVDVLEADMRKSKAAAEIDDIIALGHVMLVLATRAFTDAPHNELVSPGRLCHIAARYSREFYALIFELLTKPPTVFALCDMLSGRAFDELDATYQCVDNCEGHISAEVGAGRVLRVILHLSSALSGSEKLASAPWSESGERYLLLLFMEYVFHQVDDSGTRMLDYGHVQPRACSQNSPG